MASLTVPRPGIDGPVLTAPLAGNCCPPSICEIDLCALACSFVHDLPSGPLWDRAKTVALAALSCGQTTCDDPACAGIVQHAVYSAHRLHLMLVGGVWPQLREANPATAYSTLDDWLDRLGWEDCYRCACDCVDPDAGEDRPPFELITPDGRRICCPSEATPELERAVKRGIVLALWRLRLGIVPNLDAINFVISSLGAYIEPVTILDECGQSQSCCRPTFRIFPTSDTLPCALEKSCPRPVLDPAPCASGPCECHVTAYWELDCDGAGDGRRIYPGVLAAECIVRSILSDRYFTLTR